MMNGVAAESEHYSRILEEAYQSQSSNETLVSDGGSQELNYDGGYGTSAKLYTGLGILAGAHGFIFADPKTMGMGAVTIYLANELREADSNLEEYDELLDSE